MRRLIALTALAACGTATKTMLIDTPLTPADSYTCAMRQLARMGYAVKAGDRDAGFIQAERKASGTGVAFITGAAYYNEIAVTVLPGVDGKPTQLSVSPTRSKQEGNSARTSTGMSLTKDIEREADALVAACTAPAPTT